MIGILAAISPVFGIIALGFAIRQVDWLGPAFWDAAERITFYVFFPALLFTRLATAR